MHVRAVASSSLTRAGLCCPLPRRAAGEFFHQRACGVGSSRPRQIHQRRMFRARLFPVSLGTWACVLARPSPSIDHAQPDVHEGAGPAAMPCATYVPRACRARSPKEHVLTQVKSRRCVVPRFQSRLVDPRVATRVPRDADPFSFEF
jgi:hypothetical protein